MLIVGAGGFAKELLSCLGPNELSSVKFYDDLNVNNVRLFDQFDVLKSEVQVHDYFKNISDEFTLGLGNPKARRELYIKFTGLGGKLVSTISNLANIGDFGVEISEGVNIFAGVNISNDVRIGKGTLVYYNSNITHDCRVGEFVEISPGVNILGRVKIGDGTSIGSGAIILPDIEVGSNVIIGAGAVVTKDVFHNQTVKGIPAKAI